MGFFSDLFRRNNIDERLSRYKMNSRHGKWIDIDAQGWDDTMLISSDVITDGDGYLSDELIDNIVDEENNDRAEQLKTEKNHRMRTNSFSGCQVVCSSCNFIWAIRKKKGLPARCSNCGGKSIEIDWDASFDFLTPLPKP